jgi:hypothetical protein
MTDFQYESRPWLHILVVFGVAMAMILGVSWLVGESTRNQADDCKTKNGIMVKGMESFHCIDKSVLK